MNQHRQDIQPGDRVWFRITGPNAGIYAVGQVTSLPRREANEFGDWQVDVTFESRVTRLCCAPNPMPTLSCRRRRR